MAGQMGTLALDGGDVRLGSTAGVPEAEVNRPVGRKLHDPSVTMEEYMHYASITRADTRHEASQGANNYQIGKPSFFGKKTVPTTGAADSPSASVANEKGAGMDTRASPPMSAFAIGDEEYVQASRAIRTATWGAVFYLITTDILGPFSTA